MATQLRYVCVHSSLVKVTEQQQSVIDRIEAYNLQLQILSLFGIHIDDSAKKYKIVSGLSAGHTVAITFVWRPWSNSTSTVSHNNSQSILSV